MPTGSERPPAVLLEIPAGGGPAIYLTAATLAPIDGLSAPTVPALERVWGIDRASGMLFGQTADAGVVGVDLESGRVVEIAEGAATGVVSLNETAYIVTGERRVLSVNRGEPTKWSAPLPAVPQSLHGRRDGRLVAVAVGDSSQLFIASADHPPASVTIPGGPVAVTLYGELVAAGTESGVMLYDPTEAGTPVRVRLAVPPTVLAFSPSGHRLYVGHGAAGIAVIDRYAGRERDGLPLPGSAAQLRVDPMGRWLLTPAGNDSLWVVDAVGRQFIGAIAGAWDAHFPQVTPDGVLLVARRDSILAYDPATLERLASRARGASHWLATTYLPEHAPDVAAAPEDPERAPASGIEVYVQVASSQNPTWASALAGDLTRDAGLPARVLEPELVGEGYRVVIGPYGTRGEAEAVARKLQGRPHWIFTRERSN